MKSFTVYPAIDLRGGKVVRLKQGDPHRQTIYGEDPQKMAQKWLEAGATWLHIVNLDGAFGDKDSDKNLDSLKAILNTGAQIQFGGGLRSWEDIENVLDLGVSRIILGTVAIEKPWLLEKAITTYSAHRVAVGIDARQGRVRVRGWMEGTELDPVVLAKNLRSTGLKRAIVTDITRDGMDQGVNLDLARRIVEQAGLSVIVAGGVNSLEDVSRTRQAGLEGIIIGRALYEGQVSLEEALQC